MNREEFSRNYWRYYCMLEKKFLTIADYVEIDKKNFKCFSNEYDLLLQSVGAELDNVFKLYCGFDLTKRKTINDYANSILNNNSDIKKQRVKIAGTDIVLIPFRGWNVQNPGKSLKWWQAFTDVKHNRSGNFESANQKNVLYILAALFMLETMCFKEFAAVGPNNELTEPDAPDELSKLFVMVDWEYRFVRLSTGWALIDGGYCPLGIDA